MRIASLATHNVILYVGNRKKNGFDLGNNNNVRTRYADNYEEIRGADYYYYVEESSGGFSVYVCVRLCSRFRDRYIYRATLYIFIQISSYVGGRKRLPSATFRILFSTRSSKRYFREPN